MSSPLHSNVKMLQIQKTFCYYISITKQCAIKLKMSLFLVVPIVHRVGGNNISKFHIFDIITLYLSVLYTEENALMHLCYYIHIEYDISFFNGNKQG